MSDKKNSFQLLLEEEDPRIQDTESQEIQQRIHNRMGTMRFMGHMADMYLNKLFRTAGMKMGGRYDEKPISYQSDDYGPAGPSQP